MSPYGPVLKISPFFGCPSRIFAIWEPMYMEFWFCAYLLVLSSMHKSDFQNFDF